MRSISLLWRAGTALVLLALLTSPFAVAGQEQTSPAAQTEDPGVSSAQVGPVVRQSLRNDTSPALRDLKPLPSTVGPLREIPLGRLPKAKGGASGAGSPPLVQDRPGPISMPSPVANFEGINNVDGVLPPDTNGDIGYDPLSGTKYYMQWVNLSFEIWNVTDPANPVSLLGPVTGNTLWSGFGGVCETTNNGDPIVLFDPLANRWLGSQFALPNFPAGPFYECIAISQSADPTGLWHRYEFLISDTKMDDYPKFGVWPDGYYMSVNQFAENTLDWAGAGAVAFERDMMLAGLPAQMVYFDVGAVTLNFGGMLPSDLDGPPPPAGTPNYFSEWDDSTWLGDPDDTLRIWEFHVDWVTPANSTFGLTGYDPNALVATSDVDPSVFGIPQPEGAPPVDAIADRLMFRLQYRNFGSHQTLVSNHTVDADGTDHAGVHWFELRDDGTGWVLQQDGVYAPDGEHRWMGSIAMDASGDIALGYSVSSTSVYPSIRYAGRLASDPINTLPQAEVELIAGSGVQLFGIARWGDYSMMAVDPTDDCTFWYTQEYYEVTGDAPWQTRIGSFKFPTCTTGPSGTLQGTVTDSATGDPIPGAKVDLIPGGTTFTDEAGFYLFNLPVGTYEGIVSAYGYFPQTVSGVEILEGVTTVQDFALDPAASGVVQGTVTDGSGHLGMPLYARLDITGYPGGSVFTDPLTGHYSVELPEGSTFTFTVSAVSGGYNSEARDVTPSAGGSTEDFALTVDETICSAPGYTVNYSPVFAEEFESGALPAGWSNIDNIGDGAWLFDNPAGRDNLTGGSGGFAIVDSDYYGDVAFQDAALLTPLLDFTGLAEVALLFNTDFNYYGGGLDEIADVDVSNDGGVNWTNVWQKTANYRGPALEVVDITALAAGQPDVMVGFHYYNANFEWWWQVDNVSFGAPPTCDPIPGGLVVGNVYDANTANALNEALVASDGAPDESAITASTPDDANLDDGFYMLFSSLTGAQDFTASKTGGYASDTQTVMVVADDTVGQAFSLSAGMLSADPPSFTVTLGSDETGTETMTLSNTGGLAAAFTLQEVDAPAPSSPQPTGPFADPGRHVTIKHLADRDARALIDYNPPEATLLEGGEVISSWPTGLAYAWGIGFNTRAGDLWLGNIAAAGGDDLDYRFLTDGTNTGDTIDTSPWVGVFAADMTYNPFTRMLWQLDVGGDDCLHELDPLSMVSTGNSICPPFGTNERGLAYDPTTDTYYAGSWNDYVINHFAPDGTILDSVDTGLSISGLAFNPATSHLFVMTNSFEGLDVYVLDVSQNYQVVGGFNVDGFEGYDQAGLEIDCNGHLWAVNQAFQNVLEIDSGETGVCDWMDVPWLSEDPLSGSVAVGSDQAITLTFDTAGLDFGTYQAHLRLGEDTPYNVAAIPVTLVVVDTSSTIYLPLVFR